MTAETKQSILQNTMNWITIIQVIVVEGNPLSIWLNIKSKKAEFYGCTFMFLLSKKTAL